MEIFSDSSDSSLSEPDDVSRSAFVFVFELSPAKAAIARLHEPTIEPVDHIAFADLDNLRGVSWFEATYVRDVNFDSQGATSAAERRIVEKFAANLELLEAAATKQTVPVISVAEFAAYTKRRLAEGRGFPTRWVKDANHIQPPDCLLTGEGLRMVEQR
ncbi:hypothetical protein Fuma_06689 [Fuerstiella marisgermanici]|uniref:Uncharacterized protein n=2 Tax=Fuerstiella marisgermanici TaxID=1891926 RepID=A0A1P8WSI8_9PLAN|nr:hypothetical protein Fuma_06689 [Fuerstiella marisgermanici]